ncbi:hypothetical protein [Chryseobacterium indologenes]|uniref:Uncharacterized protein n=1 Tax=Chryseobacterium indologenes TaxID=253 RepID=A0A0N0ZXN3_CHRID|nr:hypothetical protein [Chryseobacterium indologenes]KPE51960.1 hypothetical protein AOB46_07005 [Chryseobacterium indologenes]
MKATLLLCVLISVLSFSQQKNVKISNLQPASENRYFPLVSYTDKPAVAQKINTLLQVDQLEYVPGVGGNPFALVSGGENANYVLFYNWEKMDTPKNILSIAMEGETSGAYPESFYLWKNFDLRTGNLINARDLFRPDAVKTIESLIQKRVRKEINDFIIRLKAEPEQTDEILSQIGLYEGCYTDYTLAGIGYYFKTDKIKFITERCSNHAMRALDELAEHVIEFSYKDLDKYLSPYAKSLLNGSDVVEKTSLQNKLYKGKIDGKYPITVLIKEVYGNKNESSVAAVYWYDKNKKLIEWHGKLKDNHISLTENDYYSEETRQWMLKGFVEADIKGNEISGTWQDYKTKKYLTLELEEL